MNLLSARSDDRAVLRARLLDPPAMLVVGLCAAWCDTCAEFRATFARIAASRPGTLFLWLDIEDDSEIVGDVEVEDFPTLAIFSGANTLHFGASLPQQGVVERLLDALDGAGVIAAPEAVATLPQRIARHAR
jgi:thioredoxin reductase (NADPH)